MISVTRLIIGLLLIILSGCSHSEQQRADTAPAIMTVTGGITDSAMGISLIHEHILVDFIGAERTGYHRWDREAVIEKVLPFLQAVKNTGVNTLFECTPAYLGRDPRLLKSLSERSGLNIITNTGFYAAVEDKFLPAVAFEADADSLASIWIGEFEHGIEDTGIRPGFIKISVDTAATLSEVDEKIVRAAIITHRATGLTIVSHTTADGPAFAQLKLLEAAGVSADAWVWTHAQAGTAGGRLRAAAQGAWISIDNVHRDRLIETISSIAALRAAGYLDQILISHDAGWFDPEKPAGGEIAGYTDIFDHLIPALKKEGFSQTDVYQLLIENPRNAYRIR